MHCKLTKNKMDQVCPDIFFMIVEQVCASYVAADWVAAVCQVVRLCMVCRRWNRYLLMDGKRAENSLIWYPLYVTRLCGGGNRELPCLHSSFLLSLQMYRRSRHSTHLPIECYSFNCEEPLHYDHLLGVKRRFYDDFRSPLLKRTISSFMRQNCLSKGEKQALSRWKYLTSRRKKVSNYDPTLGEALLGRERFQKALKCGLHQLGGKNDSGYRMRESDDLERLREVARKEAVDACPLPQLRSELRKISISELEAFVLNLREDQADEAMVAFYVYRQKFQGYWSQNIFRAFYEIVPYGRSSPFRMKVN